YRAFTSYIQMPDTSVVSLDLKPSRIARAIYNAADNTPDNMNRALGLLHAAVQNTPEYKTLVEQTTFTGTRDRARLSGRQFTQLAQEGKTAEFVSAAVAASEPLITATTTPYTSFAESITAHLNSPRYQGGFNLADDERVTFNAPTEFNFGLSVGGQQSKANARIIKDITHELVINALNAGQVETSAMFRVPDQDRVNVEIQRNDKGDVVLSVSNIATETIDADKIYQQALVLAEKEMPGLIKMRKTNGEIGFLSGGHALRDGESRISSAEMKSAIEGIRQASPTESALIKNLLSIEGLSIGKTQTRYEGTGFGLSYVNSAISELGGDWTIQQAPRADGLFDTTVSVRFPAQNVIEVPDANVIKAAKIARAFEAIKAADPIDHDNFIDYLNSSDPLASSYADMILESADNDLQEMVDAVKVIQDYSRAQPEYQAIAQRRATQPAIQTARPTLAPVKLTTLEFDTIASQAKALSQMSLEGVKVSDFVRWQDLAFDVLPNSPVSSADIEQLAADSGINPNIAQRIISEAPQKAKALVSLVSNLPQDGKRNVYLVRDGLALHDTDRLMGGEPTALYLSKSTFRKFAQTSERSNFTADLLPRALINEAKARLDIPEFGQIDTATYPEFRKVYFQSLDDVVNGRISSIKTSMLQETENQQAIRTAVTNLSDYLDQSGLTEDLNSRGLRFVDSTKT
ncbi:MAG: hypothetical protein K8I00_01555, partial [Candidatus Omnitrophica bacterium]|nr:hypothetical protein [Candidatus Omnitrophota bacterium]